MEIISKYVLPFIFSVCLLAFTFVAGLELIIFNESFFKWHYENRDITTTTEMSIDDLMDVTVQMLDYLTDDRDSLDMVAMIGGQTEEVFGQREKAHMVDVKELYLGARNIRRGAAFAIALILVAGYFYSKKMLYHILNPVRFIVPTLLVGIGVLGALFAIDFNRYFTIFHEIFFDNDLWILNPRTDILINMVPESYFYTIVMIGLGIFAFLIVSAIILSSLAASRLKITTKES